MPGLETIGGIVPCLEKALCGNSPTKLDPGKCRFCKYALSGGGRINFWKPLGGAPKKHPQQVRLEQERRKKKAAQAIEKIRKKNRVVSRRVKKAEAVEKEVISSLGALSRLNSGRLFQDADGILEVDGIRISVDVKTQDRISGWLVSLADVEKVTADASRAGAATGILVIRSRAGDIAVVPLSRSLGGSV